MKKDEFKPIFTRIMNFYNIQISQMAFLEFCDSFGKTSVDKLESAFRKLKLVDLSTSRKDEMLPAVIRKLSEIINGSDDDKAILAWDDVLFAMNKAGAYNSVAFKDKATMKAIELLGGWIWLNSLSDDGLKWAKKEFLPTYKAFAGKPVGITHLKGIAEIENQFSPTSVKQVIILIGYKQEWCSLSSYLKHQIKNKATAKIELTLKALR